MNALRWGALMGALMGAMWLVGCASTTAVLAPPQESTAPDGTKQVSSTPARLLCDQPYCPTLVAQWSSARAGVAVLTIGVPFQSESVTGADFHFGRSQVVRLRVAASEPAAALGFPATAFEVPLNLLDALAYKPSGWLRVNLANGRWVEETISTGESQSDVVDAMRQFLRVVDTATGTPPDARGGGGGMFDLLK